MLIFILIIVHFGESDRLKLKFNTKYIQTKGLVNYWPFNSHIQDVVGGVKLYNGKNAKLVPDRFGRSLSALSFNGGYYQLPPGSYLSNNFTVSVWVYERSYTYWHRIFDFSNGPGFDAVCFAYTYETNGHPVFDYTFDSSLTATLTHSSILPLNVPSHEGNCGGLVTESNTVPSII